MIMNRIACDEIKTVLSRPGVICDVSAIKNCLKVCVCGPLAPGRRHQFEQEMSRMAVVLLSHLEQAVSSRDDRKKPIIFLAVLITLCFAFMSTVELPAYL